MTIPEIIEDEWFLRDYEPVYGYECDEQIHLDDVNAAFDSSEVNVTVKACVRILIYGQIVTICDNANRRTTARRRCQNPPAS